jgi:hypothetical protein
MSETEIPEPPVAVSNPEPEIPVVEEARPWHGSDSPFEAMYQWVRSEIAKLQR